MTKRLPWILSITAALVLVFVAGIYVLLVRYDYNALKPRISKAVRELTGRELTIRGDIKLRIGMSPSIVIEKVLFQNADSGSRPDMLRVGRIEAEIEMRPLLSGIVAFKRLILVGAELLIETDPEGKSNLPFQAAQKGNGGQDKQRADLIKVLPGFTFEKLVLRNGSLVYREGRSGKTYIVAVTHLTATTHGATDPIEVALTGTIGHEPFEIKGSTGSLRFLRDPERAWPLNLTARALGVSADFTGSLSHPFTNPRIGLHFLIQAPEAENISDVAAHRPPVGDSLEFPGGGGSSGAGSYGTSVLRINLGKDKISGSLQIQLDKSPPIVSATFETNRLDMRPFLDHPRETAKEKSSEPGRKKGKILFPEAPIPHMSLEPATVKATVRADKVLLPGLTVHNLRATITVGKEHLEIDPFTLVIGGGVVNGWVRVESGAKGVKVAARLNSEGIDLAEVHREAGVKDAPKGNLSAAVNVRGSGGTVSDLVGKMKGDVVLVSDEVRLDEGYLEMLSKHLGTDLLTMLAPFRKQQGHVEFDCMTAKFDIRDGLARSRSLILQSEDITVVGEGTVDLATGALEIGLKSFPRKGVAGVGINLGALMGSFRLEGTLVHPSLALDPTDTALAIGKVFGGFMLLGPVGVAAALISPTKGADEQCVAAVEAIRSGARSLEKADQERVALVDTTKKAIANDIKDAAEAFNRIPER